MEIEILSVKIHGGKVKIKFPLFKITKAQSKISCAGQGGSDAPPLLCKYTKRETIIKNHAISHNPIQQTYQISCVSYFIVI